MPAQEVVKFCWCEDCTMQQFCPKHAYIQSDFVPQDILKHLYSRNPSVRIVKDYRLFRCKQVFGITINNSPILYLPESIGRTMPAYQELMQIISGYYQQESVLPENKEEQKGCPYHHRYIVKESGSRLNLSSRQGPPMESYQTMNRFKYYLSEPSVRQKLISKKTQKRKLRINERDPTVLRTIKHQQFLKNQSGRPDHQHDQTLPLNKVGSQQAAQKQHQRQRSEKKKTAHNDKRQSQQLIKHFAQNEQSNKFKKIGNWKQMQPKNEQVVIRQFKSYQNTDRSDRFFKKTKQSNSKNAFRKKQQHIVQKNRQERPQQLQSLPSKLCLNRKKKQKKNQLSKQRILPKQEKIKHKFNKQIVPKVGAIKNKIKNAIYRIEQSAQVISNAIFSAQQKIKKQDRQTPNRRNSVSKSKKLSKKKLNNRKQGSSIQKKMQQPEEISSQQSIRDQQQSDNLIDTNKVQIPKSRQRTRRSSNRPRQNMAKTDQFARNKHTQQEQLHNNHGNSKKMIGSTTSTVSHKKRKLKGNKKGQKKRQDSLQKQNKKNETKDHQSNKMKFDTLKSIEINQKGQDLVSKINKQSNKRKQSQESQQNDTSLIYQKQSKSKSKNKSKSRKSLQSKEGLSPKRKSQKKITFQEQQIIVKSQQIIGQEVHRRVKRKLSRGVYVQMHEQSANTPQKELADAACIANNDLLDFKQDTEDLKLKEQLQFKEMFIQPSEPQDRQYRLLQELQSMGLQSIPKNQLVDEQFRIGQYFPMEPIKQVNQNSSLHQIQPAAKVEEDDKQSVKENQLSQKQIMHQQNQKGVQISQQTQKEYKIAQKKAQNIWLNQEKDKGARRVQDSGIQVDSSSFLGNNSLLHSQIPKKAVTFSQQTVPLLSNLFQNNFLLPANTLSQNRSITITDQQRPTTQQSLQKSVYQEDDSRSRQVFSRSTIGRKKRAGILGRLLTVNRKDKKLFQEINNRFQNIIFKDRQFQLHYSKRMWQFVKETTKFFTFFQQKQSTFPVVIQPFKQAILIANTLNPNFIYQLFENKGVYNEQGFYIIWLCLQGKFKPILIDDRFLINQQFDQNNIGIMLLSKACAKAKGSYESFNKSTAQDFFVMLTGGIMIPYQFKKALKRVDKLHAFQNLVAISGNNYHVLKQTKEILNKKREKQRILLLKNLDTAKGSWFRQQHFMKQFSQIMLTCYSGSLFISWNDVSGADDKPNFSWQINSVGTGPAIFKLQRVQDLADQSDHILIQGDQSQVQYQIKKPKQKIQKDKDVLKLMLYQQIDAEAKKYQFVGETRAEADQSIFFIAGLQKRRYFLIAGGVGISKGKYVLSCQSKGKINIKNEGWKQDSASGFQGKDVSYLKIYSQRERSIKSQKSDTSDVSTRNRKFSASSMKKLLSNRHFLQDHQI